MEESREIKTMRYMEWERAKGSIRAILSSYWNVDNYDELVNIVAKFINEFGDRSGIN